MTSMLRRCGALVLAAASLVAFQPQSAEAAGYRQYYSGWTYRPAATYYYRVYYYKPYPTYTGYKTHHCIWYPSQPRYVYYYNPSSGQYWGRFDTKGTKEAQYSLLKPEDRKGKLSEIPEKAFPKPAPMPVLEDSTDKLQIDPLPAGLPKVKADGTPADGSN